MNNYGRKNMSYIFARDPSVCNFYSYSKVRKNLVSQYDIPDSSEESGEIDYYNVYLRIKATENLGNIYTIKDSNTLLCRVPEEIQHARNIHEERKITRTFKFTKIIDGDCNQSQVFDQVVKSKVLSFINGYNCTLMSYGASGSGKTFTVVGNAEEPGIIPRSLEYLFRTLPNLSDIPLIKPNVSGGVSYMSTAECTHDQTQRQLLLSKHHINMDRSLHTETYKKIQERLSSEPVGLIDESLGSDVILSVWVSFAEIYNENIYDLLKPESSKVKSRKKLHLGQVNGVTYIKELTSVSVSSGLEAYLILQFGLHHLKYAATSVNDHSSRSHCIFTLKIAQASNKDEEGHVSVFNFCDLAGSERIKKTHNVGDRLKESNSINTSLLVLGRCIKLIRDSQKSKTNKLIPFRESKLTQLFQNALLGHEAVSMIVNINCSREMFDETQHVLNFSAIAKDIIVEQQVFKSSRSNKFSDFLENDFSVNAGYNKAHAEELQEQLLNLIDELQQLKLSHYEDREYTVTFYKKVRADNNERWERRVEELKHILAITLAENVEHANKKARLSVVVLSSSSEEDTDEEENNVDGDEEEKLKEEIAQIKSQLKTQQEQMDEAVTESVLLESSLNDLKRSKVKNENAVNSLTANVIKNDEKIKELNTYIDSVVVSKVTVDSVDISEKENLSLLGNEIYEVKNDSVGLDDVL